MNNNYQDSLKSEDEQRRSAEYQDYLRMKQKSGETPTTQGEFFILKEVLMYQYTNSFCKKQFDNNSNKYYIYTGH